MKKGFTLIELLAVIVILSVIFAIATPSIKQIINKTDTVALSANDKLIISAAKEYATDYDSSLLKGLNEVGDTLYIDISTLKNVGLINDIDTDYTMVKIVLQDDDKIEYSLVKDTLKQVTVSFNASGGTVSTTTKTYAYGSTYGTLPIPTKTGATFEGWYLGSTSGKLINETDIVKLSGEVTFVAKWQKTDCILTYNANGGSVTTASKTIKCGTTYGRLTSATTTSGAFDGWYTAATGGTKIASTDIINDDITLYAHFKEAVELNRYWMELVNEKVVDGVTITISETLADNNIKKIKFYNNSDNSYDTTGKTFIANVSTTGETIKAYGIVDSDDSTAVDIDIVGDKLISFPAVSENLFYKLARLDSLDFNNSITTSNVKYMSYMFFSTGMQSSLFTLDVSSFDTSNVTSMHYMFDCTGQYDTNFELTGLENFDTSNVTSMYYMFYYTGYSSSKLNAEITILNPNITSYSSMFTNAARKSGSQITVNYTGETSDLVDKMIATKSSSSNVVKGTQVS